MQTFSYLKTKPDSIIKRLTSKLQYRNDEMFNHNDDVEPFAPDRYYTSQNFFLNPVIYIHRNLVFIFIE